MVSSLGKQVMSNTQTLPASLARHNAAVAAHPCKLALAYTDVRLALQYGRRMNLNQANCILVAMEIIRAGLTSKNISWSQNVFVMAR